MVHRLLQPNAPSANALAKEVGIPQSTLSRWLMKFGTVDGVSKDNERAASGPCRPEDWTAEERLRAVLEASKLEGEELGKFLRHEGLHEETLAEWREAVLDALQPARVRAQEKKRIAKLERELVRKDKALAAANAVVELQKKVHAMLGDADDDTKPESDE
jgi:hypothetical protein